MTPRCVAPPAALEIDAWLERLGHNRAWLAEQLGVHGAVLWRWLAGERTPRIEHIVAIERLTGVQPQAWVRDDTDAPAATGTEGR